MEQTIGITFIMTTKPSHSLRIAFTSFVPSLVPSSLSHESEDGKCSFVPQKAQMKEDQRNENKSYYQLKSFHKYFIESKLVGSQVFCTSEGNDFTGTSEILDT